MPNLRSRGKDKQADLFAMFHDEDPPPTYAEAAERLAASVTDVTNWLHGAFWLVYAGLLLRYWRSMPIGEAVFCAGVFLISTQQEAFHGTYRYMVPLVPLTLAISRDHHKVRHWIIALNLVFGVLMLLAFVTRNRLTV